MLIKTERTLYSFSAGAHLYASGAGIQDAVGRRVIVECRSHARAVELLDEIASASARGVSMLTIEASTVVNSPAPESTANTTAADHVAAVRRAAASALHVAEPGSHEDDQRVVIASNKTHDAHLHLCWCSTREVEDLAGEHPAPWTVEMWLEVITRGDGWRREAMGLVCGRESFSDAWAAALDDLTRSMVVDAGRERTFNEMMGRAPR